MADIKAIIEFYLRRNRRLVGRGKDAHSIRESAFADKEFREDKTKIPKNPAEAKKRSQETAKAESSEEEEERDRIQAMVDAGEAEWKTLDNGVRVCIDKNNGIVAGPKHMVGKNMSEFSAPKNKENDLDIPKVTKSKETLTAERQYRAGLTMSGIADAQKALVITETGENPSCGGFIEAEGIHKLTEHYESHGKEPGFDKMNPDEYERFAELFLMKPCGGDILGGTVVERYGDTELIAVVRYDKQTGIFAKGYPGGYIKTCMKAKYTIDTPDGKVFNPNWKRDGYDYFLREMKKGTRATDKEKTE